MSRSGYSYDCEDLNLWRGAVNRALGGKRGQAFLREMLRDLDNLDDPSLAAGVFEIEEGDACGLGVVGRARGLDMFGFDNSDPGEIGYSFGVARAMAAELMFVNDEQNLRPETNRARFERVRRWVVSEIRGDL